MNDESNKSLTLSKLVRDFLIYRVMSIQKVEMFTVICDNCKKSADEDTMYSCWNDEVAAKEVAMEADYITEGENHYCSDCYFYDDEDTLMLKTDRCKN